MKVVCCQDEGVLETVECDSVEIQGKKLIAITNGRSKVIAEKWLASGANQWMKPGTGLFFTSFGIVP